MRLDHINIKAPSQVILEEKQFFCDVLGLHEGFRPPFSVHGFWLYGDNQPVVHLTESNAIPSNLSHGYVDHIAFTSSNIENFINRLGQLKVKYKVNYLDETNASQVFVQSQSGIKIEIIFANEKI